MGLVSSKFGKGDDMADDDTKAQELKQYKATAPHGMETTLNLTEKDAQLHANMGWQVEGVKAEEGSVGAEQQAADEAKSKGRAPSNKARTPQNKSE